MTNPDTRALAVSEKSDATHQFFARLWRADAQGALTNVHMIAEKAPKGSRQEGCASGSARLLRVSGALQAIVLCR